MSTAANRRRRLLSEGTRAAGTETKPSKEGENNANVRRYATNEDSASFAIARRVLPHRRRAIFGVAVLGALGIAGLLTAHQHQAVITKALGLPALPAADLASGESIARWATQAALLVLSGLALLVYGLRRRRTDDVRGIYRWWLAASLAALACSFGTRTGLHRSLGTAAAQAAGWTPADAAPWGIGLIVVLVGGLVTRVTLDLKHCVPALIASLFGSACGVAGLVVAHGGTPVALASHGPLLVPGFVLAGLLMAAVSLLLYSRRIVLEADGTVVSSAQKPVVKKEKAKKSAEADQPAAPVQKSTPVGRTPAPKIAQATTPEPKRKERPKAKAARQAATSTTQWTDGSDGQADYDEDHPRRKLTKAERKRLRKLKANANRAA